MNFCESISPKGYIANLFDGPHIISSRPQNIIHLLPCMTLCRFFINSKFLWSFRASTPSVEQTWIVSRYSINHNSCILYVKGPQVLVQSGPYRGSNTIVKFELKTINADVKVMKTTTLTLHYAHHCNHTRGSCQKSKLKLYDMKIIWQESSSW